MSPIRRWTRRWPAFCVMVGVGLVQACGSDNTGNTSPTPSITITLSPTSASVQQGGSTTVTATVTGSNGFTGTPVVSITGAPAGVTGTLANVQTSGTTTTVTVTVNVAATTAPGSYSITVNASGTGVTAVTSTFSLTVTAAPVSGFTLSMSPATLSVTQGANGTSTVNITRSNFTGAVALAVTGAPNGVTATLNPTSATTNTSTLTVAAAANAATGSATLTITGTGTGVANQTATLPITITAATGANGNVTVDFSTCANDQKPIWFAFQNGTSGWTQVTGTADVYRFNITQSKAGIAYVTQSGGETNVLVQYTTQTEATAGTVVTCQSVGGGKTLTGTVAGLATGDLASIGLGGADASAPANGPYTLNFVASGNQDLVAYKTNALNPGTNDRLIIRRDLNIASGGAIPVLDFGASEAVTPATATAPVTGATGSEQMFANMSYLTGASCAAGPLGTNLAASASFTMRGVPAGSQRATDYHQMLIAAATGTTAFRGVIESFHTLAARTFTLPAALPAPTVTTLAGAYKRLQAVITLPSDYQTALDLTYSTSTRSADVGATFGWLGSANATLAFPDFSGVSGWQDSWMPPSNASVQWGVQAVGTSINVLSGQTAFCTEGARARLAVVQGTM